MNTGHTRIRRAADASLIVLFLGLLCVPAGRNLAGQQSNVFNENRPLAPAPDWKWQRAALEAFPAQFEAYYNDRFGYRHTLIDLLNIARVQWLHQTSSPQVCLGKKGWMYYIHEPIGTDYEITRPFTPQELERWRRMLEARRDWLAERGIPYLFVVAPDKQSIYPEHLPRTVRRRVLDSSRLDQLLAYLEANSEVRILDLRGSLRWAKAQERLFAITDSHWNDRGAYVAYARLIDALAAWLPQLKPLPRSEFIDAPVQTRGGDLAQMLGLPGCYPEEHLNLKPRIIRQAREVDAGFRVAHLPPGMQPVVMERPEAELPRAVVFRDSFAGNLIPFLSEHFQRVFYLWQELYEFDTTLIERERPDVVIQEIVERKLALPWPPYCRAGIGDDFGQPEIRTAHAPAARSQPERGVSVP